MSVVFGGSSNKGYYLTFITGRFFGRGGTCSLGAPAPTHGNNRDSPLSHAIGRGLRNSTKT